MSRQFYDQVIYYSTSHLRIFSPDVDVPWLSRSSKYALATQRIGGGQGIVLVQEET